MVLLVSLKTSVGEGGVSASGWGRLQVGLPRSPHHDYEGPRRIHCDAVRRVKSGGGADAVGRPRDALNARERRHCRRRHRNAPDPVLSVRRDDSHGGSLVHGNKRRDSEGSCSSDAVNVTGI